jgi:hypothetical protein
MGIGLWWMCKKGSMEISEIVVDVSVLMVL